jgi:nucleoside-diphosphate-sugar epimerase
MSKRIIVTGSQGFLGRHMRRALELRGREVVGIDLPGTGAEIEQDLSDPSFDANALAKKCGAVQGVIYLAATITRGSSIDQLARANLHTIVHSALGCFEAFHAHNPDSHYVYCSTFKTYGRPAKQPVDPERPPQRPDPHSYGCAKLLAERMLAISAARTGARYAVVRASCIYGPGQHRGNAIPIFLRDLWQGRAPVVFGGGANVRDDVFAPDLAYCIIEACLRKAEGAFHGSGERARTILEVAEACCRAVERCGGPAGLHPRLDPSKPPKFWIDLEFDQRRSRELLDYRPTPLADGLECEARWIRDGERPEATVAFCESKVVVR